jgi:hypothetical protein
MKTQRNWHNWLAFGKKSVRRGNREGGWRRLAMEPLESRQLLSLTTTIANVTVVTSGVRI